MGSFQNHSVQSHSEFGMSPDQQREEKQKQQKQHLIDSASAEFETSSREDPRASSFVYPVNVLSRGQVLAFDSSLAAAAASASGSDVSSPKSALNGNTTVDDHANSSNSDGYAVGVDISEEKTGFLSAADQKQSQQDHWRKIFMNLRKGLKPREYAVRRVSMVVEYTHIYIYIIVLHIYVYASVY